MPSAKELRDISKDLGIRGYSKMNKTQLTKAIEGHVKTSDDIVEKTSPKEVETETLGGHSAPVKVKRPKRASTSPWVAFCKEYAEKNNVTYKQAMGKKDEYDSWKSSRSTPKEASIQEETESEESE